MCWGIFLFIFERYYEVLFFFDLSSRSIELNKYLKNYKTVITIGIKSHHSEYSLAFLYTNTFAIPYIMYPLHTSFFKLLESSN